MLSNILRGGLILSLIIVMYGAALFLFQRGDQVIDYSVFKGVPPSLKEVSLMLDSARQHRSEAIIQLGILMLIATPGLRVLSCLVIFAWQRDYLYIFLASIVLLVLLYSL